MYQKCPRWRLRLRVLCQCRLNHHNTCHHFGHLNHHSDQPYGHIGHHHDNDDNQVDGEPLLMNPSTINIEFFNSANMLTKKKTSCKYLRNTFGAIFTLSDYSDSADY